MSDVGQNRKSALVIARSALPPTTDMRATAPACRFRAKTGSEADRKVIALGGSTETLSCKLVVKSNFGVSQSRLVKLLVLPVSAYSLCFGVQF